MKTTKNKIIKGIKSLSNAPLYCAIFVSAGWGEGCTRQEVVTKITDTHNDQNLIGTETDQSTSDETMGQDNPAYKNSSTDDDEHNNVDENNNNVDENNNELKPSNSGAEEVHTEQQEQPNIPQPTAKESNSKASTTASPVKNDAIKSSNTPGQAQQNVKKNKGTTSNSPKNNVTDNKNTTDKNTNIHKFQLPKETKDKSSESGGSTKQDTPLDKKLEPLLEDLKSKMDKLTSLNKNKNNKKINDFLNKHNINNIQERIKNQQKKDTESIEQLKQHIETIRTLTERYIKKLEQKK